MLKKIKTEDPQEDRAEIDALKHTDWVRSRDCVCLSVSLCVYMRICVCTVWSFIGFMGCVCEVHECVCVSDSSLGPVDEGAETRGETEEGEGA